MEKKETGLEIGSFCRHLDSHRSGVVCACGCVCMFTFIMSSMVYVFFLSWSVVSLVNIKYRVYCGLFWLFLSDPIHLFPLRVIVVDRQQITSQILMTNHRAFGIHHSFRWRFWGKFVFGQCVCVLCKVCLEVGISSMLKSMQFAIKFDGKSCRFFFCCRLRRRFPRYCRCRLIIHTRFNFYRSTKEYNFVNWLELHID